MLVCEGYFKSSIFLPENNSALGECVSVCTNPAIARRKDRIVEYTKTTECIFYCKMAILFLSSSKILTPPPPLRPASVYPPPLLRGEDRLAGRRGGGEGSIFWKTREIGLPSYSKICTLWPKLSLRTAALVFHTTISLPLLNPCLLYTSAVPCDCPAVWHPAHNVPRGGPSADGPRRAQNH